MYVIFVYGSRWRARRRTARVWSCSCCKWLVIQRNTETHTGETVIENKKPKTENILLLPYEFRYCTVLHCIARHYILL